MWRHWNLVIGFVAVSVATAGAQTPIATPTDQTGPTPAFINLSKASNDYKVGPGDLLDIQVVGHDDLHQTLRISNSGEINFSPVGLVCVSDLSSFDVEYTLAQRLSKKNLIKNPEVLVFIRDYQAKPIFVSGAVVNPGEFVMSQELTVSDAILLAGGLQFNAADEGIIHRRVSRSGGGTTNRCSGGLDNDVGTETVKVDLKPMKTGRFFENALSLKRGDVLVVPRERMNPFYVVGELVDPQNFAYPPGQTLMVSQAISWAGGPLATAKLSDGMLIRYDAQGHRQELKVDYSAILKGDQPDFPIKPHDIIFVPGSGIKTFAYGVLNLTDSMVMSAAFRIGRTYQLPSAPARPSPGGGGSQ